MTETIQIDADEVEAFTVRTLTERGGRTPDFEAENNALLTLVRALADRPEAVLETLSEQALALCGAGSAGVSLLDGDPEEADRFVWAAIAGAWAAQAGGGLPRDASPCGLVLARDTVLLLEDPTALFPAAQGIEPAIVEVLLAPFHAAGRPVGAVWVLSHDPERRFDLEDRRRLMSLARFASAAFQSRASQVQLTAARDRLDQTLSNATIIGAWDWRLPEDRVTADARFAGLFGVDVGRAAAGVPMAEFAAAIHPDDRPRVTAEIEASLASGEPFVSEYRLHGADGQIRSVLARGKGERGPDGAPLRFPGVVVDITDQRRAEADERVSTEKYRNLFDNIDAGFCVIEMLYDADGAPQDYRFIEANPAFAAQTGLADPIGRRMREMAPDHEQYWFDIYGRVARSGESVRFENEAAALGFWYDVHAYRIGGEGGNQVAVLFNDITARRRAELDLKALNEELENRVAERTGELQAAEETLRQSQKMEAVGQLTGGIAHDFNNLLTGVTGGLQMTRRRIEAGRPEEAGRYIDAALEAAERAAALTHRLLAFARRQSLDSRAHNLNDLVVGMEDLLRRTLGETVVLGVDLAPDLWPAATDANQLESALLNLALNARDAMPHGGRLTVATSNVRLDEGFSQGDQAVTPGDYVMLSVTDTGLGMAPEVLARAYDPFFTTKPIGQGTGLGLSMIYGFARQSGGSVNIDSEPGQGACVRLFLPRAVAPVEEAPAEPAAAPLGQGERVLLVEDDFIVRMLMTDVLTELGYAFDEAADARSAIAVLESDAAIDLLITDVGLPDINGRQLAEIARSHRPGLKVLFVTGYAENAVSRSGFLEPGMEMMSKPFALEALAAKVRELLEG